MDRETLEEYPYIVADINDLEAEIRRLQSESFAFDTVRGSTPDYPYTSHPISIYGAQDSQELKALQYRLANQIAKKREVEKFVDSLPNEKIRRVVRYKALSGRREFVG